MLILKWLFGSLENAFKMTDRQSVHNMHIIFLILCLIGPGGLE